MSEENKEVVTPQENNTELEQLKESVKKLEAKNYELIGKLQKLTVMMMSSKTK